MSKTRRKRLSAIVVCTLLYVLGSGWLLQAGTAHAVEPAAPNPQEIQSLESIRVAAEK